MKTLYTAEALATGAGRDGHARTADGSLDLDMAIPTEMGGSGRGANPEQLFALGYAACFHSALQAVARRTKADVSNSSVGSRVHIGPTDDGGFQLAVELEVTLPALDAEAAQQLADAAHQVCPYSNATRGNIDVTVTVAQD
ncbi:Ohr family peroxiredoxin [Janibacter melonis]|uniref:Ohr family peroxiredoxin n=1 Tax=Janibacter melonis TaxID=262209 RepID=A0A5P8FPG2_9MICO|nr:organic hydroperoxide resistance protein [Janibacter melonis]QFQ31487.2 Ohr family peroxiredoxin [Janibacter melonis]